MNGFFDDFNLPAALPDERKWNSAYSRCNADTSNGFFINDQFHAHNTVFSGNCDRGQSISRPRATLDFSDNGTRTIVFDWDGELRRNFWYLDIVPRMMDISGQVNIEGIIAPADPAHGLRFSQNGQAANIYRVWREWLGVSPVNDGFQPLPAARLGRLQAGAECTPPLGDSPQPRSGRGADQRYLGDENRQGAFNLTQDRYYLLWNVFSYNSDKANVPLCWLTGITSALMRQPAQPTTYVTHNYRLVNTGSDFRKAFGPSAPAAGDAEYPRHRHRRNRAAADVHAANG